MLQDSALSINTKFSTETIACIAFITYFANGIFRSVTQGILGHNSFGTGVGVLIPYVFLLICCIKEPHKYVKLDFVFLFSFILVFFSFTYLVFPEYDYYYRRQGFGVWDHVLNFYRGIYAYLFIRIMKNQDRVIKCIRIAGWILIPYFLNEIRLANERGYWVNIGQSGTVESSYSVAFGYQVLPFVLFFLFMALKDKNISDIIASFIGIMMILSVGSRGQIVFIAELIFIYIIWGVQNSQKKILIITGVIISSVILYLNFNYIMLGISTLLSQAGISSRFVIKVLNGTIAEDNGRLAIWSAALKMVLDNPFGYGAMGSRHIITSYIFAGYPHNVVLELLIDYGLVFGGAIFIFLMYNAAKIIFSEDDPWRLAFIPFFCASCCLFISMTYWSIPSFWACIGIGVNNYLAKKEQKAPGAETADSDNYNKGIANFETILK